MKKTIVPLLSLCPFGLTNDPYPGQCPRYIDLNKNSFCDNSQSLPSSTFTSHYHLIQIFVILTLFYIISLFLINKKLLTLATHRKIWNILLLITFLISTILGILLIMKINYNWQIPIPNSLFWHVEAGIAMTIISFFHILWHWRYFQNMLK